MTNGCNAEPFVRPPRLRPELMCSISYPARWMGARPSVPQPGDDVRRNSGELHSGGLSNARVRALADCLARLATD
jgi:hypothetical protein